MEFINVIENRSPSPSSSPDESESSETLGAFAAELNSRYKLQQRQLKNAAKARNCNSMFSAQGPKKEDAASASSRSILLIPEQQIGNLTDTLTTNNSPDLGKATNASTGQHINVSQQRQVTDAVVTLTMGKGELRSVSVKKQRKKKRKATKTSLSGAKTSLNAARTSSSAAKKITSSAKKSSAEIKKGNFHRVIYKSS